MDFLEILIIVIALVFIVISIFFVGKDDKEQKLSVLPENYKLSGEEEKLIKERVREVVEYETSVMLEDTDVRLSTLSNEKIMSINEFSDQVLEKIETNHKDIVFLYDMLQKKQDELKETVKEAEETRVNISAESISASEKMEKLGVMIDDGTEKAMNIVASAEAASVRAASVKTTAKETAKASRTAKGTEEGDEKKKAVRRKTATASSTSAGTSARAAYRSAGRAAGTTAPTLSFLPTREPLPDSAEAAGSGNNNEKILELYRQKKSVLEISKALGMGQGEVKLVIDLYGR